MNLNKFWLKQANLLKWLKKPTIAFKDEKWFENSKINIYENCILKNLSKEKCNKIAISFYSLNKKNYKYSYSEINTLTNNLENVLRKNKKLKKNSRILIHGSASIETSLSMLACAKMGIFNCVIFNELNKKSIDIRVKLFKPDIIITRAKDEEIKEKFSVNLRKKILIFNSLNSKLNLDQISINDLKKTKKNNKNKLLYYKSRKDFFCLFTSGSTGEPKGIIHSYGGYLLYAVYTCKKFFGINSNSKILTASDAGWINGHTYALYGPLSLGATTIILESPLLILDIDFLKKILLKDKITVLYLPVTLIRLLKEILNKQIKKNFIKVLGSMGEPLAPQVGSWFAKIFNYKNSIVNTYFQTETAGIITAPTHKDKPLILPHGSVGKISSLHGMIIDKKTNEILLQNSWPGCMNSVINGKSFFKRYWNEKKYFRMFDLGIIKKKALYVSGRTDDVINIRGHRIGSGEVESVLLKSNHVIEVSAIAIPDKITGNQLVIFCKTRLNYESIKTIIHDNLAQYFGSYAIPKDIYIVKNLPKTRSGKILRRLLRNLYLNPRSDKYGDLSTILNKKVVSEIQLILNKAK